jgi:arylsulfatase A-like enzyme
LITLDTTRADRLGCYGARNDTPTIDALAREGVRFETCICPAPLTLPSHCSLMTGLVPLRHGVHDNGPERLPRDADTLAEILSRQGYETAAVTGAFVLDRQFGLNQGFASYDDQMPSDAQASQFRYAERRAAQVTDAALRWLASEHGRPAFLWVHYFDAHAPYDPPDYDPTFATRTPYDAEIAYVDSQLRRLLAGVEEHLGGPTLVVLTADHGEGLGQHGEDTHGLFTYNQTMRVPLVVRFADGRHAGKVVDGPVALVDVMPSVIEWLGLQAPPLLDGVPRLAGRADNTADSKPDRPIYFENRFPTSAYGWATVDGLVVDRQKLIHAPKGELYDLERDPNERTNLFDSAGQRRRQLSDRLEELVAEISARPGLSRETAKVTDQDLARLQGLGYVGARPQASPADSIPARNLADPKDMLGVYRQIQDVTILFEQRQPARATELLLELLETKDPFNKRALRLLAARSVEEDALRNRAIECLRRATSETGRPCTDPFIFGKLGQWLLAVGRSADAVEAFETLVRLDPRSAAGCRYLAEAHRQAGNAAQARQWRDKALELSKAPDQQPDWSADEPPGRGSMPLR